MYLKYGNYRHDDNECTVSIRRDAVKSECEVVYQIRERWEIAGRLQVIDQGAAAANQAALTAKINVLKAAYAVHNRDIGFYDDAGKITSHSILSAVTLGGVKVMQPPSFPEGSGAEYTTFRNYSLAVEAIFPVGAMGTLLSWAEMVRMWGGGPEYGFLPCLTGPPQKQLLRQATTYKAMQVGMAVGRLIYPVPPGPLWSSDEHIHVREKILEVPPDSSGQRIVRWQYQFESIGPMQGYPTSSPIN